VEPRLPEATPLNDPDPKLWLRTIFAKNGHTATDEQLDQLEAFVRLLLDWNSKINLISRKDEANIWRAHILHSAAILLQAEIRQKAKVLDLGSGGGLPGLVIKIMRPDLDMTCLDATRKKMDAVADMARKLNLRDCATAWGRAEDLGKDKWFNAGYDVVVARAVAPLKDLVAWTKPFLRPPHARLITLKGGDLQQERRHADKLPNLLSIKESALTFAGSEQIPGVDKKIVVVDFELRTTRPTP
jgi:16S rRNA (guanine527-N7)-methyltransferase